MHLNRFWSSVWTVAGFLLLITLLQMIADQVVTLFGLLGSVAPSAARWAVAASHAVVPIAASLTYIDWRWGWKADNAGLRPTFAARFWFLPGLAGGLALAGLAFLLGGWGRMPQLNLGVESLVQAALTSAALFGVELILRGIAISRFEQDLSGRDVLLLALVTPVAWVVLTALFGLGWPAPQIRAQFGGLAGLTFSALQSLLFLQTQSVWLVAGVHIGLYLGRNVLGLDYGQAGLLLVTAVPAALLLWRELNRMRTIRPAGPRPGKRRVVYGKTVRGPWGPH
ncbi:hypothetical protein [Symbiobacterium thermophilum]|uniref:Uncharacterized protein n=1 Tax=Symbiobacterium thermophilum TaxID=2734 RepID=A0A953I7R3_SYMTR|nr:hypothetical protein [Symbiobacterium thermophilum]MBY6275883.1 hypothetical protein [Symbiobacterium thermophilum]